MHRVLTAAMIMVSASAWAQGLSHQQPTPGEVQDVRPATPEPPADRDTIAAVQDGLKANGYEPGTTEGVFTPATRRAIERYQADRGLPVTGEISPALVADLQPNPLPEGEAVTMVPPAPTPEVPASSLIGRPVHSIPGDKLGRITDLVVGMNGAVTAAVVDVEDLYGDHLGDTRIPWADMAADVGQPAVTVPLTASEVRRAAGEHTAPPQPVDGEWAMGERARTLSVDPAGRVLETAGGSVAAAPE
ncbi:MAG: peptidoglycan-binding protein [Actinomycetota bacterium]